MLSVGSRGQHQAKSSTAKRLNSVRKYWFAFCRTADIPQLRTFVSDDAKDSIKLLVDDSQIPPIANIGIMRAFVNYMHEKDDANWNSIERACSFLQWYYKSEWEARCSARYGKAVKGLATRDVCIKSVCDHYRRSQRSMAVNNAEDLQADMDRNLSCNEQLKLLESVFAPPTPQISSICLLMRLQLRLCIVETFATAARCDCCRVITLAFCFIRFLQTVAVGLGLMADMNISNGGKTNQTGRVEYRAMVPHVNPWLDTAWDGLCLLWRFQGSWRAIREHARCLRSSPTPALQQQAPVQRCHRRNAQYCLFKVFLE